MTPSDRAPIRLLEVLAPLSLAVDLGMGAPDSWVIRSSVLSRYWAQRAGLDPADQSRALYVTLLRHVGCTSTAEWEARWLGDEQAAHEVLPWLMDANLTSLSQFVAQPGDTSAWHRFRTLVQTAAGAPKLPFSDLTEQHCLVARQVARQWGLGPDVEQALDQGYERWDGTGQPRGLSGTSQSPLARIAGLSLDVVRFHDWGGLPAAVRVVSQRRGRFYDPALADLFLNDPDSFQKVLAQEGSTADLLAAEPTPHHLLAAGELDSCLATLAEVADAQTSDRAGWSRRLHDLITSSAALYLLPDEALLARRAAWVQGLGRLTVGTAVWTRPGPLKFAEWERVRLVPYHSERILSTSATLAPLGSVVAQACERLNGSGYPRGLRGTAVSRPSRLLAAATVYQALVSDRPYRRALDHDAARSHLLAAVAQGELDTDAVAAVLGAAEGRDQRSRVALPFELTPRELDVLKLLASGLSNRDAAIKLGLALRTIEHHVERLYSKIHVRSRAEATAFALRNSLVNL